VGLARDEAAAAFTAKDLRLAKAVSTAESVMPSIQVD
jgi:hypothetical protein